MLENYSRVFNYVDARNTMVIGWIKWLNFTFEEPKPYGPKKIPFYKFYLNNKNVWTSNHCCNSRSSYS